jgi:wyosine [tRNA(Phe)-imidazoG37] synthetase (radical SAM superfamily)
MTQNEFHHGYGPVPSKRLGRSLGVDLVPFKTCSYDCVYCQLGKTTNKTVERRDYAPVEDVLEELERKLSLNCPLPDYISLAGSGEPTLNLGIGHLIRRIKQLTEIPVAVFTNGSLLWMPEVQEDLMDADLVLPSLDAGDKILFRYVNRPHTSISFEKMVQGTAEFTKEFSGTVWLEVFLLGGVTGVPSEMKKIAALIEQINPDLVQLNTLSRPPTEDFAFAVAPEIMEELRKLVPGKVELIVEQSHAKLPASQRKETDDLEILALLSRRPCTVQGISTGLGMNPGEVAKRLHCLSQRGDVIVVRSNDMVFYEKAGPLSQIK